VRGAPQNPPRSRPCPLTPCVPTDQRKDYSQALLKPQSDFHHHVEVGEPLPTPPNLARVPPV